jgi:hypothetical protein
MNGDPLTATLDGRGHPPADPDSHFHAIQQATRHLDPDVLGAGASFVFLLTSWENDDPFLVCPVCGQNPCRDHVAIQMPVHIGPDHSAVPLLVSPD